MPTRFQHFRKLCEHRSYGALAAAVVLLGGCQPAKVDPAGPPLPARFSGSGSQVLADDWWKTFRDVRLNQLETRALRDNFSLESSWQRLRQARAVARREAAGLFPSIDAFGEGTATRLDANGETIEAGLGASYELDLWGRISSRQQAAAARADARLADYRAAAISLSAQVARTWYGLAFAREGRALLKDQVQTNRRILDQLRVRLKQGQGGGVDVLRQEQLLRATLEQLALVEADIGVLTHQLSVLLGRAPGRAGIDAHSKLPNIPPLPRTGLPAELLQRRPDVLAAWHELQAADAELAAALSERLPRLSIGATLSSTDADGGDLFDDWLATALGNLTAPLVDGGARRAEVKRAEARRAELLADYRQSMIEAIREVEDSLVLERQQITRIAELRRQLELAQKSHRRLQEEYLNGADNFIDVLSSLTDTQQLQRDLLQARRNRTEFRIALHRALAGGLRTTREP